MHITTFETFVAFSEKGESFLVKEKQFGSEGGGSLAFLIINARKKKCQRFEISRDFGIGNGSALQKIPEEQYITTLKVFTDSLSHSGFTGIDIYPEACKADDREKCLTVSRDVLTVNKQAYFGREKEDLVQAPFRIQIHEKNLVLFKDNKRLLKWTPEITPDVKQMQAWMCPGNSLIVLFSFVHFNNHHITDILFSKDNNVFKRLSLKDLKQK